MHEKLRILALRKLIYDFQQTQPVITCSTPHYSVSIVNFEQVNAGWKVFWVCIIATGFYVCVITWRKDYKRF